MLAGGLISEYMTEIPLQRGEPPARLKPMLVKWKRGDPLPGFIIDPAMALWSQDPTKDQEAGAFVPFYEFYIRHMLATCAPAILVPAPILATRKASPKRLKRVLAPSLRGRIKFPDRRLAVVHAVYSYFKPVWTDLGENPHRGKSNHISDTIHAVAWQFYRFVLTARSNGQAVIPVPELTQAIGWLLSRKNLSRESKARLSIVHGTLACLSRQEEIPGFVCKPHLRPVFTERIEEIMEDSYLLEACQIRRFLSRRANIASLKRDLRKLLNFIAKKKAWAKGLVTVSTQTGRIPDSISRLTEGLMEMTPSITKVSTPLILDSFDELTTTPIMRFVAHPHFVAFFLPGERCIDRALFPAEYLERLQSIDK